jgi:hypothetical protein
MGGCDCIFQRRRKKEERDQGMKAVWRCKKII